MLCQGAPAEAAHASLPRVLPEDPVEAVVASTAARPRRANAAWTEIARVRASEFQVAQEGAAPEKYALALLKQQEKIAKRRQPSTAHGQPAIVHKCDRCVDCTLEWRFYLSSAAADAKVIVETKGNCTGNLNVKKLKLLNAREHGQHSTPACAQQKLDDAGITLASGLRPSVQQLQHQRRPKYTQRYHPDCVGEIQAFIVSPPDGVVVDHASAVCTAERLYIPFSVPQAYEAAQELALACFLADFTFNTNRHGLVLGACGPVGLHQPRRLPQMRFMPLFFVLGSAEDKEAISSMLMSYLACASAADIRTTDGFFDCKNIIAAQSLEGFDFCIHRCLQHVKKNVQKAARSKHLISGAQLLARQELLPEIIRWIDFSAWLPSDLEFSVFWADVVSRLQSSELPTDFGEAGFAEYLGKNILVLDTEGIRAHWASGLGAVPLGYTTYAPNAIERHHRTLNGVIPTPVQTKWSHSNNSGCLLRAQKPTVSWRILRSERWSRRGARRAAIIASAQMGWLGRGGAAGRGGAGRSESAAGLRGDPRALCAAWRGGDIYKTVRVGDAPLGGACVSRVHNAKVLLAFRVGEESRHAKHDVVGNRVR